MAQDKPPDKPTAGLSLRHQMKNLLWRSELMSNQWDELLIEIEELRRKIAEEEKARSTNPPDRPDKKPD